MVIWIAMVGSGNNYGDLTAFWVGNYGDLDCNGWVGK